jgi:hypothetical protein
MEAVNSSETLISVYQTIWCHIPEDCNFQNSISFLIEPRTVPSHHSTFLVQFKQYQLVFVFINSHLYSQKTNISFSLMRSHLFLQSNRKGFFSFLPAYWQSLVLQQVRNIHRVSVCFTLVFLWVSAMVKCTFVSKWPQFNMFLFLFKHFLHWKYYYPTINFHFPVTI